MSAVETLVLEVLEEVVASSAEAPNEQMEEVLNAYNTDIQCGAQFERKLNMIAWDRQ